MTTITVVGLGPADEKYLTAEVASCLADSTPNLFRTTRHPGAKGQRVDESFDEIYELAERIEDVYRRIVDTLIDRARTTGPVTYVVPGSPLVAESTVALLRATAEVTDDITVHVLPALSYVDLCWAALGVDPHEVATTLINAHEFRKQAGGVGTAMLVAQCDSPFVVSEIKLSYDEETPEYGIVLQRLGLHDELVTTCSWAELDRVITPDHLTTLWIPPSEARVGVELLRVDEMARRLRAECPWDAEQTHASLCRYVVEEAYELVDVIEAPVDEGDIDDNHLVEELGDVFYQVFAHAAIASEEGRFTIGDVARALCDKYIERHPHVYGDVVAESADDVVKTWESNKQQEKGRESVLDGVPRSLPALLLAEKMLARAARLGLDASLLPGGDKAGDGSPEDLLGAQLFRLVQDARSSELSAESALRKVVTEFTEAVRKAERVQTESTKPR